TCTNPSPTNAYITELIHDRARVNWDNMNDANCMVQQYRIRYREQGTSSWSSKTMAGSGLCVFGLNTTSKKILGLSPSTTYDYYMKAWYCGGGTSGWSTIQNFTTEDECQGVINFAVTTPTTTKATFTWDTTAAYSFARIKLRPDTTGGAWTTAGGFGVFYPALTKNKNGLTPGQAYRASARTWCDPTGGAYRSAGWTSPIFWTQPSVIRLVNPNLTERTLLRITDILSREVNPNNVINKTTLFYIYNNGTVEKRIIFK
ncbi:MAG: fibronectin type III domain-containing protein, partial [Flavobacteriales bacterium]|nr:fibronectin type III domain-containing protein [Flavobacteriales bacterium]